MEAKIEIKGDKVTSSIEAGSVSKSQEVDILDFYQSMSALAHLDTGILPLDGTGVLAIRKALNHTQITMQVTAGIYRVLWGKYERDPAVKHFMLAQPYHIMIGDIADGTFLGARHFYSPKPITSPHDPLYHCNLPNLNCKGYNKTGVGWVCLYHSGGRSDWKTFTLGAQARALQMRVCAEEAFNDANMSETDGPRFYAAHKKPKYFWDPAAWEAKSNAEGYQWTCDEKLLIPILVKGTDAQGAHLNGGVPLTLGMAIAGKYNAYYRDPWNDKGVNKPVNAIARGDKKSLDNKEIMSWLQKAAQQGTALPKGVADVVNVPSDITIKIQTEIPKTQCGLCKKKKPSYDESGKTLFMDTKYAGKTCADCIETGAFFTCAKCAGIQHFSMGMAYGGHAYCSICVPQHWTCKVCYTQHAKAENLVPQYGCVDCVTLSVCSLCNQMVPEDTLVDHQALDPTDTEKHIDLKLCKNCAGKSTTCECGFLREAGNCYNAANAERPVCQTCVAFDGQHQPFYNVMTALNADVEIIIQPKTAKVKATKVIKAAATSK